MSFSVIALISSQRRTAANTFCQSAAPSATLSAHSTLAGGSTLRFVRLMQRLVFALVFLLALQPLHAVSPVLTLENELIPSPARVGSLAPRFVDLEGHLLLSWSEPDSGKNILRRCAACDLQTRSWKAVASESAARATPLHQQNSAGETTVGLAGRVAKAWFVPSEKDPEILLSTSTNAGEQFLMPVRIEDAQPTGAPDLVLLGDGTVYLTWPETYNQTETALWLRRVSPSGALSVPVLLATIPTNQPSPSLALVSDSGGKPALLLLAYSAGQGEASQIIIRLLTIDPANDANRRNTCLTCPDPDAAARGYALRGRITSRSPAHSTLTVQHSGIPGVLPASSTEFKVDPTLLEQAGVGTELFARIEKRGPDWWLFSARLIVQP